jgi:hypothetical protein
MRSKTNSYRRLLALFDEIFGPDDKLKSSFRKVRQAYDQRTDEHVVLIGYRARPKGAVKTTPKDGSNPRGTICFYRRRDSCAYFVPAARWLLRRADIRSANK